MAVETAAVTAGTLEESIEVVGTLTPKFEAQVRAEYAGTVAEIYVTEWVPVKKGTPLARLDTRELEAAVQAAKAAALQAEAAAQRARREYERAVKLKEAGLMTQQGLDDAPDRPGRGRPRRRGRPGPRPRPPRPASPRRSSGPPWTGSSPRGP